MINIYIATILVGWALINYTLEKEYKQLLFGVGINLILGGIILLIFDIIKLLVR